MVGVVQLSEEGGCSRNTDVVLVTDTASNIDGYAWNGEGHTGIFPSGVLKGFYRSNFCVRHTESTNHNFWAMSGKEFGPGKISNVLCQARLLSRDTSQNDCEYCNKNGGDGCDRTVVMLQPIGDCQTGVGHGIYHRTRFGAFLALFGTAAFLGMFALVFWLVA